jgi:soluble lytic murein transglycosylase-like protein
MTNKIMFCLALLLFLISCKEEVIKPELTKKDYLMSIIKNNMVIDSIILCSEKFNLSEELITAIIFTESTFDENAMNENKDSKDIGLMQLNTKTFKNYTISELYDIEFNIINGSKLLRSLIDKFDGNLLKAICAYNCGEYRVVKDKIPLSTIIYANNVLNKKIYYEFEFEKFKDKK